ncbi:MAG: hypothetical protein ACREOI_16520 [bacterium]
MSIIENTAIERPKRTGLSFNEGLILAGEFPGDGLPKPVAFPDPAGKTIEREQVQVIILEKLIELKLASGMTASHRLRDLADVQDLIIALNLPLEFEEKLDASVGAEYRRLWEAAKVNNSLNTNN